MPDTSPSLGGTEWPRRYTQAELHSINKPLGQQLDARNTERLQQAAEVFQWGTSAEKGGIFHRSNKERRSLLNHAIKLCQQGASPGEIQTALRELDAIDSQHLGGVGPNDPRRLQLALRSAVRQVPSSGRDRKRARRRFINDLYDIFQEVSGRPTRRVHDQEYGPFREFVIAALTPFNAAQGCEADIKEVLRERAMGQGRQKNAVGA
jgi:hypothetical protein